MNALTLILSLVFRDRGGGTIEHHFMAIVKDKSAQRNAFLKKLIAHLFFFILLGVGKDNYSFSCILSGVC